MQKFEYKFVKIELESIDLKSLQTTCDCREVIREQAVDGWRFVQAFSPQLTIYGRPVYYELIFERLVG